MRVHAALGMCVACALFAYAPGARAQQAGLGLNWVRLAGAESCVTATQLMNRLEARAGRILFVRSGEATLSIDGYVSPVAAPEGWAVTLELDDAHGKVLGRRDLGVLPGRDCSVVADTAELILDLTLDPDGTLGTGIPLAPETQRALDELLRGESSELNPASLPHAAQRAPAHPPPKPAARARSDRREPRPVAGHAVRPAARDDGEGARFDASALGGLGLQPGPALGIGLHASLPARIGWSVELGVASFPDRRSGSGFARADFQLLLASLALCPWQVAGFALCAGAEYGTQRVAPSALGQPRPASQPLVDVLGIAAFRLSLAGPLFMQARASAVLPLLRNRYRYRSPQGERTLYRTAALGARVELGLGLQL
jgi:hypothetical protein